MLNADDIGIYAVLGVFILGVAMPRGLVARELQHKLEPMTTNFLLPLFFVYSGLNTRIGLVNTPVLWGITLVIILAACLGKGVAYWAVARWKRRTPARCAGDWRPDELLGNRLKAYVVPLEGNGLNVEDVEMHCGQRLPRYMVPESIELRDSVPKTSSGKVDRPQLARLARAGS